MHQQEGRCGVDSASLPACVRHLVAPGGATPPVRQLRLQPPRQLGGMALRHQEADLGGRDHRLRLLHCRPGEGLLGPA